MPTPFLVNVDFDTTKSVSVQNRRDEAGGIGTYILLKPGTGTNFQLRKANLDDQNAELVFKLDRNFLVALTSSLSAANANSTVTGSF
jgi:hypothetical protein